MTEFLYYEDAYIKEFDARVVSVDEGKNAILLDRTAFYPGGGGQPADEGFLIYDGAACQEEAVDGEMVRLELAGIEKNENEIWHIVRGRLPSEGMPLKGKLNWERRYALMRTHSAMHVLTGVVWREYGAKVTGGNMEPLKGRMDFEFEKFNKELIDEIEIKVNNEIEKGREIITRIIPRREAEKIPDLIRTKVNLLPRHLKEIRIVEIIGLDMQADGGTHVANTKEIGKFKIVGHKSKGRINKRLHIEIR